MDTIKGTLAKLAAALAWIAGQIAVHPRAVLIAWAISLVVVARVF